MKTTFGIVALDIKDGIGSICDERFGNYFRMIVRRDLSVRNGRPSYYAFWKNDRVFPPGKTSLVLCLPVGQPVPQEVTPVPEVVQKSRYLRFVEQLSVRAIRTNARIFNVRPVSQSIAHDKSRHCHKLDRKSTRHIGGHEIDFVRPTETDTPSDVIVTDATPAFLTVTPMNGTVQQGLTQQLTVLATFIDNPTEIVTPYVRWTSSDPSVVVVYPGGLAYPRGPGLATVTANIGGAAGSTTLTVH